MILRLVCIWLVFLFIAVIADARNHEPEIYKPQYINDMLNIKKAHTMFVCLFNVFIYLFIYLLLVYEMLLL
jgi:hypothetical protein